MHDLMHAASFSATLNCLAVTAKQRPINEEIEEIPSIE